MSRSTTRVTTQKDTYLHEPSLTALTAENAIAYVEATQPARPNETREKREKKAADLAAEMTKAFAKNKHLIRLAELVNAFTSAKTKVSLLSGLSTEQADDLRQLTAKRREFREFKNQHAMEDNFIAAHKDKVDEFFANQRKFNPLHQTLQWWELNLGQLLKVDLWEKLKGLTTNPASKNQAPDPEIQMRIKAIDGLRDEWKKHQAYAGISSDKLSTLNQYITVMEEEFNERLKHIHPAILREFVAYVQKQVKQCKKQIIYSMLARLQCVDDSMDLEYDDVLTHMLERIDQITPLQKTGKRPDPRRTLNANLIADYTNAIINYCALNSDDHALVTAFAKLRLTQKPADWVNCANESEKYKLLTQDPILLFCANVFPELCAKLKGIQNITQIILKSDAATEQSFVINKMHQIFNAARSQYQAIMQKPIHADDNPVAHLLVARQREYLQTIEEIGLKLDVEMKAGVDDILADLFERNTVSDEKISDVTLQSMRARNFKMRFLRERYLPEGDFIYAIAQRLRGHIQHNKPITMSACGNIFRLFVLAYPTLKGAQIIQMRDLLMRLPLLIKHINPQKPVSILHFLVNYLEKPFLNARYYKQALQRHEHIAREYHEPWEQFMTDSNELSEHETTVNHIATYMQNVALKAIEFSDKMTLENFDDAEACALESELKRVLDANGSGSAPLLPESTQAKINAMRAQMEQATFDKMNDTLAIKEYLFIEATQQIDIKKLSELINKTNSFFSNTRLRMAFLASIAAACLSLLRNYCLNAIETDVTPDLNYIDEVSKLFSENFLQQLYQDEPIRHLLKTYISTYDGTKTTLSKFLVAMTPNPSECTCEQQIAAYAKKRLQYVFASKTTHADDYAFFSHYMTIPAVTDLISQYQAKIKHYLGIELASPKNKWNKKFSGLVELIGTVEQVKQYRCKRIRELCESKKLKKLGMKSAHSKLKQLQSMLNPNITFAGRVLPTDYCIADNNTLDTYLDQCISSQHWSPVLECVVAKFGTARQLQDLHCKQMLSQLSKSTNFSKEWLGGQIQQNTPNFLKARRPVKAEKYASARLFFIEFIGAHNTNLVCAKLDKLLMKLIKISSAEDPSTISSDRYAKLLKMIASIKPLFGFYKIFSDNEQYVAFFATINNVERKFRLHHELHTTIKPHTDSIASNNNNNIRHTIQQILAAFRAIERKDILGESNIRNFIEFFDNEILQKLEAIFTNHKEQLNFALLARITNLLAYMSSPKFKQLLMAAHKEKALTNPYWLSLINHIDERSAIDGIAKAAPASPFNTQADQEFNHMLTFAKRLNHIQHTARQLMKNGILREAGVQLAVDTRSQNMTDLLKQHAVSQDQLIDSWRNCAEKLMKLNKKSGVKENDIRFMLKQLMALSDEIMRVADTNPTLLSHLTAELKEMPAMINAVTVSLKKSCRSNFLAQHSMWQNDNYFGQITAPMQKFAEKALSKRSMQLIENYVLTKINPDKLQQYRQACNDNDFDQEDYPHQIKRIFKIKKRRDAIKVMNTMKVYARLATIVAGRVDFNALSPLLDKVIEETQRLCKLSEESNIAQTLRDVKELADTKLATSDDKGSGKKQDLVGI